MKRPILVTFGGAEVGGNIAILVPEGERAYILVARSGVNFVH